MYTRLAGDDSGREAKAYLGKVEAACLLEAAISCSPYNHHMKILAIDVYRQLGSFARAIALFNDLDVKQIQVGCHCRTGPRLLSSPMLNSAYRPCD